MTWNGLYEWAKARLALENGAITRDEFDAREREIDLLEALELAREEESK